MNKHVLIGLSSALGLGVAIVSLTPVLPALRALYGVSNARMGILVTSLVLSHAGIQLPAGIVTDKLGTRPSLALAMALGFTGTLLPAFYSAYGFVAAMRVLAGLGTGLGFVAGIKYATAHSAGERQGVAQGLYGGLINVGCIIPFLVNPWLLAQGWPWLFVFSSLFFLGPLLALLLWGREPPAEDHGPAAGLSGVLKNGPVWALGWAHSLYFGGTLTIATWISTFLLANFGGNWSLALAGLLGAGVTCFSALGRLLSGFSLKLVPPQRIILASFFLLATTYALAGQSGWLALSLALLAAAALISNLAFAPVFWLAFRLAPAPWAGTSMAMVNFIATLGGLLYPVLFGFLLDQSGGFVYPFLFLAALAALALLPAGYLQRHCLMPAERPGHHPAQAGRP